ncbi:fibronectin type III domain-containing protein [Sphingomonas paucimobilis]|uniref:fibronectin type III domain-containing protein n=1 Tax=Sphingomonas paucimobilis TaxID=13689 RepID=UPI001E541677|nr:fibronectin type III domain-containing protein [Sphingomonas paucimobilis]
MGSGPASATDRDLGGRGWANGRQLRHQQAAAARRCGHSRSAACGGDSARTSLDLRAIGIRRACRCRPSSPIRRGRTSQIVVSWHALESVQRPQVVLGHPDGTLLRTVDAVERSYVDAKSGQRVHAFHARLDTLTPDTEYMYAAVHDGAGPEFGNFRTAPRGRATFTFTSFGDQGTPTLGRRFVPPAGVVLPNAPFVNDNLGGPAGADTTTGIERIRPLFHLFNGDLCYATLRKTG